MRSSPNRRTSALVLTLVMVVPILAASTVAGQTGDQNDVVGIADGRVAWTPVRNLKTVLYFERATPPETTPTMRAYPFGLDPSSGRTDVPSEIGYGASQGGVTGTDTTAAGSAVIVSQPITHHVNLTGDNALTVQWEGTWSPTAPVVGTPMTWTVTLAVDKAVHRDGTATSGVIAKGESTCDGAGNVGAQKCTVALKLHKSKEQQDVRDARYTIETGSKLTVTITPRSGDTTPPWSLRVNDDKRPSYLEIISEDAVKVATWTTNHESEVQSSFRPTYNNTRVINKIDAFFAVKSAFGLSDYYDDRSKDGTKYNNVPDRKIGINASVLRKQDLSTYSVVREDPDDPRKKINLTQIQMNYDRSNSSLGQGLMVFRFDEMWDFGGWPYPKGEFVLQAGGQFRSDDPRQATRIEARWDFVISKQGITIRPFNDDDPATQPNPLESQDHELAAGGSTTFLALVRNDGDVHDNITLTVERRATVPAFGWHATILGDELASGNVLPLAPGKEALVRITVRAPADAIDGNSAIYQLVARSKIDPSLEPAPYTVIATVTPNVREGADVVVLKTVEEVQPGKDNVVKVYLWNKGTRPASLRLELRPQTSSAQWNVSIDHGGTRVSEMTIAGIPAGDLAPVTLLVKPDHGAQTDFTMRLNATLAAGGAGIDRDLKFTIVTFAGFRVELMRGINADTRTIEMACGDPSAMDTTPGASQYGVYCNEPGEDDAPRGSWFRVWVTNTGDITDEFRVSIVGDSIREVSRRGTQDQRDPAFARPEVGTRDLDGKFSKNDNLRVTLQPGETGEAYVWVPHQTNSGQFRESDLSFVVGVRSAQTGRELRREATISGWDSDNNLGMPGWPGGPNSEGRSLAVKLEAAERVNGYSSDNPVVDTTRLQETAVTKLVDLSGTPTIFRVRVTNGASWATWDDEHNSSVKLSLLSVNQARDKGWNVSMRWRADEFGSDTRHYPWKEILHLENRNYKNNRQYENFYDREVEIKFVPPSGGGPNRIAAGQAVTATLLAEFPGTGVNDRLELVARVAPVPNVNVTAVRAEEDVHPGQQTAFILNITNSGTDATAFNLKAEYVEPTTGDWSALSPREQNLNLTPQENVTLALIVGAPANAPVGSTARVNVKLTFHRIPGDPTSEIIQKELNLTVNVRAPGKLKLESIPTTTEVTPGGVANFTLQLSNDDSRDTRYEVTVTPIANWTQSVPSGGVILAGEARRFAYILNAPTEVVQDRTYSSIVKVVEVDQNGNPVPENFALSTVHVNVVGGTPFPIVSAVRLDSLVDRGASAKFEMSVRNLGSREGKFPLEARAGNANWPVHVEDEAGNVITDVTVRPNELARVFVVVSAPQVVPEGTTMPVTLTAFNPNFDRSSAATVRAVIHDYAVDVALEPARADVVPGESVEFVVKVTNLGNGPDNLTLTPDLQGLGDWSARLTAERVQLQPGASTDVRLIVSSPKQSLPSARQYAMSVIGGTVGGTEAGLPKNDSAAFVVNVLNYRAYDVEGDGFLELAVDLNKRPGDGLEHFREVFTEGVRLSQVDNLSGKQDGKITFLLDTDETGSLDGVADLYFDPNDLFVYAIRYRPDINGDATPDYLLDTDNDGVIDHAWDTATRTLWEVTVIRAFGGTREQFLIDVNADGDPDRYYDPDAASGRGVVTRTIPQDDGRLGLDTENTGKASKFYDTKSGDVGDTRVSGVADFASTYWYFFAGFALVIVLSAVVLARRRTRDPEE